MSKEEMAKTGMEDGSFSLKKFFKRDSRSKVAKNSNATIDEVPGEKKDIRTSKESRNISTTIAERIGVEDEKKDDWTSEESRKVPDDKKNVGTSTKSRKKSTSVAGRGEVSEEKKNAWPNEESGKISATVPGQTEVPDEKNDVGTSTKSRKKSTSIARRGEVPEEKKIAWLGEESRKISTTVHKKIEVPDDKKNVGTSTKSRKTSTSIAGRSQVPEEKKDVRTSEESRKNSATIAGQGVAPDEKRGVRTSEESKKLSTTIGRQSVAQDEKKDVRTSEESRKNSTAIARQGEASDEKKGVRTSEESRKMSTIIAGQSVAPEEKNNILTSEESRKISTDVINDDRKTDNSKTMSGIEMEEKGPREVEMPKEKEACKEYVIEDNVGKIKLTEMINNSIKKAMLNIVKEGAYTLADSPEIIGKDPYKKMSITTENRVKDDKPVIYPKNYMLLPATTEPLPHPSGIIDDTEANNDRYKRESYPRPSKKREIKITKQKGEKPRKSSGKMSRQVKGSGNFKTDNRRMTGNVNIYICSEANDNANDPENEADENHCTLESETVSGTKTSDSTLSISTSKLVAALKKKKCFLETLKDSEEHRSFHHLNDDDDNDDVLGLCDECSEYDFPDSRSFSSKACTRESTKSGDPRTNCTDTERDYNFPDFYRYAPRDKRPSWLTATTVGPNYENDYRTVETKYQNEISDLDDRCFCYNDKSFKTNGDSTVNYQNDRKSSPGKSYRRRSSDVTNKCPCIIEEDEKISDTNEKIPGEKFTVADNRPVVQELSAADDRPMKLETRASRFDSGEMPLQKQKSSKFETEGSRASPVSLKTRGFDESKDLEAKANTDSSILASAAFSKRRSEESSGKRKFSSFQDDSIKQIDGSENNPNGQSRKTSFKSNNDYLAMPDEKRKSSYFKASTKRATSLTNGKNDEEIEKINEISAETFSIDEPTAEVSAEIPIGIKEKKDSLALSGRDGKKPSMDPEEKTFSSEKKSKSRISMAIASRKSSVAASRNSFNAVSTGTSLPEEVKNDNCECGKPCESFDRCCVNAEITKDESCKCRESKNQDSSRKTQDDFVTCENPNCWQSMSECQCDSRKRTKDEQEFGNYCCSSIDRCCDSDENSRKINKSQLMKRQRHADGPRVRCNRRCNEKKRKSMICVYCDNQRDKCVCNAPIRKCNQCRMSMDICNCATNSSCDCKDRKIVKSDYDDERTIRVTAWRPRLDVGRYFARSSQNVDDFSNEDCNCWENPRICGTDELPYQKRDAFSDVMSELQQKMGGPACCRICNKVPCSCCHAGIKFAEKINDKTCVRTMGERRNVGRSRTRSRSNSPVDGCNYGPRRNNVGHRYPKIVCDKCRTSPCRCQRGEKTLKCYYCKNSPCTCIPVMDTDNSRSFRNADSSRHRRRKERCNSFEENMSTKMEYENNVYLPPENNNFLSSSKKQRQIRKCYRESPNLSNSSYNIDRAR